jgi:hypothetical protein
MLDSQGFRMAVRTYKTTQRRAGRIFRVHINLVSWLLAAEKKIGRISPEL